MPEKIQFTPYLMDTHCLIDVRTPLEYFEDHIPGAHNVPLLSNEERVEIGTIYKQQGAVEARRRGLQLTCSRFYQIVEKISAIAGARPILVYCWRGGLRSLSVATLLKFSGIAAKQLTGGYKAYRNHVVDYFNSCKFPSPFIVLHGMTGTGKTTFINGLDCSNWYIVDLEQIASHRGSVFGAMGLDQNYSQKRFETLLWDAFRKAPPHIPIVLEGESQRIGKFSLPGALYETMGNSCKIWCHAKIETRIERLALEYGRIEFREEMQNSLKRIGKKIEPARYIRLSKMIENWDVPEIARGLIEGYYDKMYYKNRSWTPNLELNLEDFIKAEQELKIFWDSYKSL